MAWGFLLGMFAALLPSLWLSRQRRLTSGLAPLPKIRRCPHRAVRASSWQAIRLRRPAGRQRLLVRSEAYDFLRYRAVHEPMHLSVSSDLAKAEAGTHELFGIARARARWSRTTPARGRFEPNEKRIDVPGMVYVELNASGRTPEATRSATASRKTTKVRGRIRIGQHCLPQRASI